MSVDRAAIEKNLARARKLENFFRSIRVKKDAPAAEHRDWAIHVDCARQIREKLERMERGAARNAG